MNEDIIFDKEKFKVLIHYIISKCDSKDDFGKTVLYKLAYFSDFNYYELYEKPISGAKYVRKTHGPIPPIFDEEIKAELINEHKIKEIKEYSHYPRYKYKSLKNPNFEFLSENEIFTIDNVINMLSHMNATQISKYSHGDLPWRIAKNDEELDYEYVFYREPEYSVRKYEDKWTRRI